MTFRLMKACTFLLGCLVAASVHASYEQAIAAEKAGDRSATITFMTSCAGDGELRCIRGMARLAKPGKDNESGRWSEAIRWYRIGASRGDAMSARWLGTIYYRGDAGAVDFSEALKWFRIAAEGGNHASLLELTEAHVYSLGVQRDIVVAAALAMRAKDLGVPDADGLSDELNKSLSAAGQARVARLVAEMASTGKLPVAAPSVTSTGPYFYATTVLLTELADATSPRGQREVALGMHPSSSQAALANACNSVVDNSSRARNSLLDACTYSEKALACDGDGYFAVAESAFEIGSGAGATIMLDRVYGLSCGKPSAVVARKAALEACLVERKRAAPGGQSAADGRPLVADGGPFACTVRMSGRSDGFFNGVAYDFAGVVGGPATAPRGLRRYWCWGAERSTDKLLAGDHCVP